VDIKELRKVNKLSQKSLSELLGVAENYVYLLEKGVRKPSKTLRLLLDCVENQLREKGKEVKNHGKRYL
jgi:DNA-binding transcriptional regulator YiaG